MSSSTTHQAHSDAVDLVCAVNRGRSPKLLRKKFTAMAGDSFAFLRASAMLGHRAIDMAALPRTPVGWVSGDLHLQNFGCFRGGNRLVYFDLNDFDEAARLPVSVDLTRLLASIQTAAPGMKIARRETPELIRGTLLAYAQALARGKAFWLERETATGAIASLLAQVTDRKRRTLLAARTHAAANARYIAVDGQRYLNVDARDPIRRHISAALQQLAHLYANPQFFEPRDIAFRVAGMGSLGIPRYVALVRGKGDPDRNALIDFKLAAPSSAAAAMPEHMQPAWANEAARVVAIQDACQAASPAYLSAVTLGSAAYVVRELQPVEDRVGLERLARQKKSLAHTLQSMARLSAYAQMRSAGRLGAAGIDELMAFGTDILQRPDPWMQVADAVDAANTAAYREFAHAWRDQDTRLVSLCAVATEPEPVMGATPAPARPRPRTGQRKARE